VAGKMHSLSKERSMPRRGKEALDSSPVKPAGFPALLDAARQQTELVCWVAESLQQHQEDFASMAQRLTELEKSNRELQLANLESKDSQEALQESLAALRDSPTSWKQQRTGSSAEGQRPGEEAQPRSWMKHLTKYASVEVEQPAANAGDVANAADIARDGAAAFADSQMQAMARAMEEMSSDIDQRLEEMASFAQNLVDRRLEPISAAVREVKRGVALARSTSEGGEQLPVGFLARSNSEARRTAENDGAQRTDDEILDMIGETVMRSDGEILLFIRDTAEKIAEETLRRLQNDILNPFGTEEPDDQNDNDQKELSQLVCQCGNHLMDDAKFCRMCGTPRPAQANASEAEKEEAADQSSSSKPIEPDPPESRPESKPVRSPKTEDPMLKAAREQEKNRQMTGNNEQLMSTIRIFAADVNRRLPDLEEEVNNLKPCRLKIPVIQDEMGEFGATIADLVIRLDAIDKVEKQRRAMAPQSESDEDAGPSDGAHPPPEGQNRRRALKGGLLQEQSSVSDEEVEALRQQLAKLEKTQSEVKDDTEQLLSIFEDRLKTLDEDYRVYSKTMDSRVAKMGADQDVLMEEDRRAGKTWNLANQVDVIQSLVAQEMSYVTAEVDNIMKAYVTATEATPLGKENLSQAPTSPSHASLPGNPISARTPRPNNAMTIKVESTGPAHAIALADDKVKKLQECYQQTTVKLAALKSVGKNTDALVQASLDKIKRLSQDFEQLADICHRQECRWEYFSLHGRAGVQPVESIGADDNLRDFLASPSAGQVSRQQSNGSTPVAPRSGPRQTSSKSFAPSEAAAALESSENVNAGRIGRIGKKLAELDGELLSQVADLRSDFELMSRRYVIMTGFLPRRIRRIVESVMDKAAVKDETGDMKQGKENSKGKSVKLTDEKDIKHFEIQEVEKMPWQLVGQPDAKWDWCFKNQHDMARDLVRHFETIDDEKAEFENRIIGIMEDIGQKLKEEANTRRTGRTQTRVPTVNFQALAQPESSAGRMDQIVMPQFIALEDRFERMMMDFQDFKKQHNTEQANYVSKEEFEVVSMRTAKIELFDPALVDRNIERLDTAAKHSATMMDQLAERIRQAESALTSQQDIARIKGDVAGLKKENEKVGKDVQELVHSTFNTNSRLGKMLSDMKAELKMEVEHLQKDKASSKDLSKLAEKILKIEGSVRDSRQILSDGGSGADMNAVVKRIILNMEDKLIMLEKKIDALAQSAPAWRRARGEDQEAYGLSPVSPPPPVSAADSIADQEQGARSKSLSAELSQVSQAVHQLKQDITVSRVDIEQIMEQGHHQVELAERLKIVVEGVSGSADEEGTTLSVGRLQVMVAAAARQLVAGSKWISKDVFDTKIVDIRKEQAANVRQLQAHVEELYIMLTSMQSTDLQTNASTVLQTRLPKLQALTDKLPPSQRHHSPGRQVQSEWTPEQIIANGRSQRERAPGSAPAAPGTGGLNGPTLPSAMKQTPRKLVGYGRPGSKLEAQRY